MLNKSPGVPCSVGSNAILRLTLLFSLFISIDRIVCARENDEGESSRIVRFDHLLFPPIPGSISVANFDIGEVDAGEKIVAQINILNRSGNEVEIISQDRVESTRIARLLKKSTFVADKDNGLMFVTIDIPENATALAASDQLQVSLGGGAELLLRFAFKYRDAAFFRSPVTTLMLNPQSERSKDNLFEGLVPIEISNDKVLEQLQCEPLEPLSNVAFSVISAGNKKFVRVNYVPDFVVKKDLVSKIRLVLKDKVVSETMLQIKYQRSVELIPSFVSFKSNPSLKVFQAELIVHVKDGTENIEHVQVFAEHVDAIPVKVEFAKMSKKFGRVYLSVAQSEKLQSNDLIKFEIRTPITVDEQVLSVILFR
jgi:hypothetical protein